MCLLFLNTKIGLFSISNAVNIIDGIYVTEKFEGPSVIFMSVKRFEE